MVTTDLFFGLFAVLIVAGAALRIWLGDAPNL